MDGSRLRTPMADRHPRAEDRREGMRGQEKKGEGRRR
jgi:hypothetical protein